MVTSSLSDLLDKALLLRQGLFEPEHQGAFRLFNGFYEGCPSLAVDLYAATLVIHNYADPVDAGRDTVVAAAEFLRGRLPWLKAVIIKNRNSTLAGERNGLVIAGEKADRKVCENGVWYAVDLTMNRDAGLYLDTRNLREWAKRRLGGKTVLNTFAYTGSLGVAALAGGAARVVQLDRNGTFLKQAEKSGHLNGIPPVKGDFLIGDFWSKISYLKKTGVRFDCVFVDPPFFAVNSNGVVDLSHSSSRLINKVRPLINDGGFLVSVNNALFVSGREYLNSLEELCADGYLSIDELIDVPPDFAGYAASGQGLPITDPSPFNHSTKIAVLKVRRKAVASPGE